MEVETAASQSNYLNRKVVARLGPYGPWAVLGLRRHKKGVGMEVDFGVGRPRVINMTVCGKRYHQGYITMISSLYQVRSEGIEKALKDYFYL